MLLSISESRPPCVRTFVDEYRGKAYEIFCIGRVDIFVRRRTQVGKVNEAHNRQKSGGERRLQERVAQRACIDGKADKLFPRLGITELKLKRAVHSAND